MSKEELNVYIMVQKDKIKNEYEKDIEQLVQKYNSGKINFAIYSSQKEALDKKRKDDISKTNTITKMPNTIHYTNLLDPGPVNSGFSKIKVKNI